jgi:hypothetical protein
MLKKMMSMLWDLLFSCLCEFVLSLYGSHFLPRTLVYSFAAHWL